MPEIRSRSAGLPQVTGLIGQSLAAMSAEHSDIVLQRFERNVRSGAARAGQSPLGTHEGGR